MCFDLILSQIIALHVQYTIVARCGGVHGVLCTPEGENVAGSMVFCIHPRGENVAGSMVFCVNLMENMMRGPWCFMAPVSWYPSVYKTECV